MQIQEPEIPLGPDPEEWNTLFNAAKLGSDSALGKLFERYRTYLILIANAKLGKDLRPKVSGSDLVQESFLEAARDFTNFRGDAPEPFQYWLRQILNRNLANAARHYRGTDARDIAREQPQGTMASQHGRHNTKSAGNTFAAHDSTASKAVIKSEETSRLHQALERLPESYLMVIQLRNYERRSFDEIGQILGRSSDAARKLWARAIESLKQQFDEKDSSK